MSNKNLNLNSAKQNKNDEFYTLLDDIRKEVDMYVPYFKGKTVYCNCDDPNSSNFFLFFKENFVRLGLKGLMVSGLQINAGIQSSLFAPVPATYSYALVLKASVKNPMGYSSKKKRIWADEMYGAGDFRSKDCLALLEKADIVVTNPPFSLWREFFTLMMEKKKQILLVGNKNAITYKQVFPYVIANSLWFGEHYITTFVDINGQPKKFGNVGWFTNIPLLKTKNSLDLQARYYDDNGQPLPDIEKKYPKYDNYDAINVDKLKDIPCDYKGIMGVPITFLDYWNPIVPTDCKKKEKFSMSADCSITDRMDHGISHQQRFLGHCGSNGLPSVERTGKSPSFFTLSGQPNQKATDCPMGFGTVGKDIHSLTDTVAINGFSLNTNDSAHTARFRIVGVSNTNFFTSLKYYKDVLYHGRDDTVCKKHIPVNHNLTIFTKLKPMQTVYFTASNVDGFLLVPYSRVLIQRL